MIENQEKQTKDIKSENQVLLLTKPSVPYVAPPISLLIPPENDKEVHNEHNYNKQILTDAFDSLNVEISDINVKCGLEFSLYECNIKMQCRETTKTLIDLERKIAKRSKAEGLRVFVSKLENCVVYVEIPNKSRRIVRLSEIVNSSSFQTAKSPISFALGKSHSGDDYVCDVCALPHLLIAGSVDAGTSRCLHSLIVSLLFKASAEDIKMILIDPKGNGFSVYKGIQHLLFDDVICDVDKALTALDWVVGEMDRRISFLAKHRFRNIDEHNQDCEKSGNGKMPQIVVIVDEFADLMTKNKSVFENLVNRIARLSTATGVNMILATQKITRYVISEKIRNNFPSRVALRVTSASKSKTILGEFGAEKLIGKCDMLYISPKSYDLQRLQGAYITMEEVQRVVEFVKANNADRTKNELRN